MKPLYRRVAAACALATLAALSPPVDAAVSCPSLNRQPYDGPLFDAMSQIDGDVARIVNGVMSDARVQRMALFARDKRRKRHNDTVTAEVEALGRARPDAIVVGSPKIFDAAGDLPADYVASILSGVAAGRYRFVGEILYTHADKATGEQTARGERFVDPAGRNTEVLLAGLKARRIPVMTHWETYDWSRDRPAMAALYSAHSDIVFIWPHVGFASPAQAEDVLTAHPNVVATLSKRERTDQGLSDDDKAESLAPAMMDDCGLIEPDWKALLIRYRSRFLFAVDAHKPSRWTHYERAVRMWREALAQLPPDVAADIAWNNANRLYGTAP